VTDQDKDARSEQGETLTGQEPFDEFAELERRIRWRLRSNQRFLERFMDEAFDDDEDLPEEEEALPDEEL
jgi:hypothetical protein